MDFLTAELFFKLFISQRYAHNVERNWKNTVCTSKILLICKFLNFPIVFTKKNKLSRVRIQFPSEKLKLNSIHSF